MRRETPACLRCGSEWVTPGGIGRDTPTFHPVGIKLLTLANRSVALKPDRGSGRGAGFACLWCGLVWGEVNPRHLRQVIRRAGTDETREWMAANQPAEDPYDPDLPPY